MSAKLSENYFFKMQTVLRITAPSCVFNEPSFLKKHFPNKECFAILTLESNLNKFVGSVSWEDSGFDFEISLSQLPNKSFIIIYKTLEHDNWIPKYDTISDIIIENIFTSSFTKCSEAFKGIDKGWDGRKLHGLYLKKKKEGRETVKFLANIETAKSNKTITGDFYKFIKKYSSRLVASYY